MTPMKFVRTKLRLTQKQLAEVAGVGQATVCRWEKPEDDKDRLEPSREDLARIRSWAAEEKIKISDAWFFQVPKGRAA